MILRLLFAFLFLSSIVGYAQAAEITENPEIKNIFEEARVNGTFVLLDVEKGTLTGFNGKRANDRFIPASTFKIANSLIGLSVGAIKDVDEILPYGGEPQFLEIWEKDMSLRDAIKISNVPIYQELARRIGHKKMQENVKKLSYGNQDIGAEVDQFWLSGPLKISAVEQVQFLSKLAQAKLNFPKKNQQSVIEILELETTDETTLYGKTGWQTATDPGIGWWVGWVKRSGKIYTFALNIDMVDIADAPKRIEIGKKVLKLLKILN